MLSHIQGSNTQNFEKNNWGNLLPISIDCIIGGSLSLEIYCLDKSNINFHQLILDTYWTIANCCYIRKFERKY